MDFYQELTAILHEEDVKTNERLSEHTTFHIGGPADYYVTPSTKDELKRVLALTYRKQMPVYLLGNGSNVLFGDKGYRGLVIKVGSKIADVCWKNETTITAGSGILLSKLALIIAEQQLTGFEFASGIPGSLGGAVAMNAGAYGGEIKDSILAATVCDSSGQIIVLTKEELNLRYRNSMVQEKGYFVLDATFSFEQGDKALIKQRMDDLNGRRREKQPLEYPSAGSTFKRPNGYYASKLIDEAGLRGYRVGDAFVSEKHCGFVVNAGNATAQDVLAVIAHVTQVIAEKYQVEMEPEVRLIGEF